MEPQNHNNSETSTAESDHHPPEKPSSSAISGGGRSYECTFCKRGFTNAQALGGHMNIHRKEKAKAKTKSKTLKDSSYLPQILSTDFDPGESNYRLYFPTSNYGVQTGKHQYNSCFPVWRHDCMEDHRDENLISLGVGLCPSLGEDEVDLELRLGQYPL